MQRTICRGFDASPVHASAQNGVRVQYHGRDQDSDRKGGTRSAVTAAFRPGTRAGTCITHRGTRGAPGRCPKHTIRAPGEDRTAGGSVACLLTGSGLKKRGGTEGNPSDATRTASDLRLRPDGRGPRPGRWGRSRGGGQRLCHQPQGKTTLNDSGGIYTVCDTAKDGMSAAGWIEVRQANGSWYKHPVIKATGGTGERVRKNVDVKCE